MGISARNQLKGVIDVITEGAVNAEVELVLNGGDRLVAIVTRSSVQRLMLVPGRDVLALIKAPWVIVMAGWKNRASSARNQLAGRIAGLQKGLINTEVALRLPGGTLIYAILTNESVAELGLREEVEATALIKASNIIQGVNA